MPVLLSTSRDLPQDFDRWISTNPLFEPATNRDRLPDLPARLENAFEQSLHHWCSLARALGREPSALLAHAPTVTPNASDLGVMLAWTYLVHECAKEPQRTLVICDDPWLFRHLADAAGVDSGRAPGLMVPTLKLWVRGAAARFRRALMLAATAIRYRGQRTAVEKGSPAIIVFAHPASARDGYDAYFGHLASEIPRLGRVLHTDGESARAARLLNYPRTISLHAWGDPWTAFRLMTAKWRPSREDRSGPDRWLIRRAAAIEGSTSQGLMTRWQSVCQERWLEQSRPQVIAWPWENHGWQRELTHAARRAGVRTIGYQHSVVGRHAANHSPAANADGLNSIPDVILCNGQAGYDQLLRWGIPSDRLVKAGALRAFAQRTVSYDPTGPVFVALPMMHAIAREMLSAIRAVRAPELRFVVKVHPMTELTFDDTHRCRRTTKSLEEHDKLRAVLYSATTVGLEALIMGLPTLRFLPSSTIAIDILSPPALARPTGADTLEAAIARLGRNEPIPAAHFFSPPDMDVWRAAFAAS